MANTRRNDAQRRLDLRNAFSGVALTERDQRLLDWLATCDQDTKTALAALNRSRPRCHARPDPLGLSP